MRHFDANEAASLTLEQLTAIEADERETAERQVQNLIDEYEALPTPEQADDPDHWPDIDTASDELVGLAQNIIADVVDWRGWAGALARARAKAKVAEHA